MAVPAKLSQWIISHGQTAHPSPGGFMAREDDMITQWMGHLPSSISCLNLLLQTGIQYRRSCSKWIFQVQGIPGVFLIHWHWNSFKDIYGPSIKMLSNRLQNNKIALVLWGARKKIKLLLDLIMSVSRNARYWIKSAEKQKENLIQGGKGREGFACRNWIFPCNFIFM